MVFEDLNLVGYSHLEHRSILQIATVECALSSVAKMHASGIAYEIREKTNIGNEFKDALFEPSIGLQNEWYLTGLEV